MRSLSEIGRLLNVDREKVKDWSVEYAEHLGRSANPAKGETRQFSDRDLRVLALIATQLNAGADADDIVEMLHRNDQDSGQYLKWSLLNSPLFQDPPDDLDETSHGALIGGMASRTALADVARSYWAAADELMKKSVQGDAHELDFPILFLARHCTEIYLKAMLNAPPEHHDLDALIRLVEKEHGASFPNWIGERLRDFHRIDGGSVNFRYAGWQDGEFWADFYHLRVVMEQVMSTLKSRSGSAHENVGS